MIRFSTDDDMQWIKHLKRLNHNGLFTVSSRLIYLLDRLGITTEYKL